MFKLLKFYLLILCMQICVSASSKPFDAEEEPLLLKQTRGTGSGVAIFQLPTSHCSVAVGRKVIELPVGLVKVHVSVLEMLSAQDCQHLVEPSRDSYPVFVLKKTDCQRVFKQFASLIDMLNKFNLYDTSSIKVASAVSNIPQVIVQCNGGRITVSDIIFALFESAKEIKNGYTPFENLLINLCCFQANAIMARAEIEKIMKSAAALK
jgi:hypothetical protein